MQLLTRLYAGAYPDLSAFFSVTYLGLFLPLAVIFYGLTPKKWKKYALLLESIGFYWLISGVYIGYLFLSALAIYGFGLWMQNIFARRDKAVKAAERPERKAIKKAYGRRARAVLTVAVAAHIGLILVLKYSGFFMTNVNALFGTGFAIPEYVKPLGLSFFILQSVSYLVDVYRQTIQADRNLARLGLFLGFFPGIVEGPICRYSQTAQALWDAGPIRYENLCFGLQRILFGLMKKLVVADRLNPIVEELFTTSESYPGYMSLLAGILYTVQLYMDFSGSMDAVCGTAQEHLRILDPVAHHPGHLVPGLHFLPRDHVRPPEKAHRRCPEKAGQPLWPPGGGLHRIACRLVLQRPVARGSVALYFLRPVAFRFDSPGQYLCPLPENRQRKAPFWAGKQTLPGVPDA